MHFTVIDEERRVEHISVNPKDYGRRNRYYYFISQTLPEYRPIIYGVASRPLSAILMDSLKRLFNLS